MTRHPSTAEMAIWAVQTACTLWPLIPATIQHEDFVGVDAHDPTYPRPLRVQIKGDSGMIPHGRRPVCVFHEIYKCSGDWSMYGPGTRLWHPALAQADDYIFVGPLMVVRVPVHVLAQAERGQTLWVIRPNGREETAMGFFLPVAKLDAMGASIRDHDAWPASWIATDYIRTEVQSRREILRDADTDFPRFPDGFSEDAETRPEFLDDR